MGGWTGATAGNRIHLSLVCRLLAPLVTGIYDATP